MLLPSLVLGLGALVTPSPERPDVAPPRLAISAVRFFVPQQDEVQTSVLAFFQVPYAIADSANARIAWKNTIEVFDTVGTRIYEESWWAGAPASFRIPEAYAVETLRFPFSPGRYRLVVTVQDSVSGRSVNASTELTAFDSPPAVSDLLLASEMRIVSPGDTTSLPGEISRGNVRFVTAPDLVLDGMRPNLAFLLEAYGSSESAATTRIEIRNESGSETVYRLTPFEQMIPAGGGVIRGHFSLEGLPEGRYQVVATVSIAGRDVQRTGTFEVGSLQAAMTRNIAMRNAQRGLDETYFTSLSEDELDEAVGALDLIAKPSELEVYKASGDGALSVSAKRQFLIQFWADRDLDKSTPVNETRMAFYDAIELANQEFMESGRNARPGWRTDRGRVFVKYGKPDDRTQFPAADRAPSFEIWRYTQGRMRYYIFADPTNFGQYRLVKTNDLQESSMPNWCEIVTPQAVTRNIEPYLGQRFLTTTGGSSRESGMGIYCN
ncbi:MAG TPA: GWxTD domain-containing protein [Gemmatimonadales bacterium]|nr:GWxTD domain-containing protein [Gemmatimonadales bacterium]